MEGVDDHCVSVFHLAVALDLRIIGDEHHVVKQVVVDREQLTVGVLPRQTTDDQGLGAFDVQWCSNGDIIPGA